MPISDADIAAAKQRAMNIYERTQCQGVGCCGDIGSALDSLAHDLTRGDTRPNSTESGADRG